MASDKAIAAAVSERRKHQIAAMTGEALALKASIATLTAERDALRAEVEAMREALKEIAGPRDLPHGINAMIAVRRIAKDALAKSTGSPDGQQ